MRLVQRDKKFILLLVVLAVGLYVLAGSLFNPFIIWTSMPLYITYMYYLQAMRQDSEKKLFAAYGYLIVGVGLSYLYHMAWYFDWDSTKTGSSTSALIFIWFPIYAVILGYVGYVIGYVVGIVKLKYAQAS